MWSSQWEQASEEVILSVVQVGQHFENKTKARSARNRTPKTPKKARQRSQTPASGTGGADRKNNNNNDSLLRDDAVTLRKRISNFCGKAISFLTS